MKYRVEERRVYYALDILYEDRTDSPRPRATSEIAICTDQRLV